MQQPARCRLDSGSRARSTARAEVTLYRIDGEDLGATSPELAHELSAIFAARQSALRAAIEGELKPRRPAGPEPIRLVGHRRHRGDDEAHGRHGGNVPDHPDPPGGRRSSCGDIIRDARWSFLPGCRHRREPERACRRSRLAATRDAPRDARGGDRSPAPSLPRRRAELPRYVLHRRGRAPLYARRDSAADLCRGGRTEDGAGRRAHRRRPHLERAQS